MCEVLRCQVAGQDLDQGSLGPECSVFLLFPTAEILLYIWARGTLPISGRLLGEQSAISFQRKATQFICKNKKHCYVGVAILSRGGQIIVPVCNFFKLRNRVKEWVSVVMKKSNLKML